MCQKMSTKLNEALDAIKEIDTNAKVKRASWTGQIFLELPSLGMPSTNYNVKGAKVEGSRQKIEVTRIERATGKEVFSKRVIGGKPIEEGEVTYGYFLKEDYEQGKYTEIQAAHVANMVDGQETAAFDRTHKIEIIEEEGVPNVISLQRLPEYRVKELYMLKANTNKDVNESSKRVFDLVSWLQEKQLALLGFFSWGRGWNYYYAVIYPYHEQESDKTWLLMGMAEGTAQLDTTWSVRSHDDAKPQSAKIVSLPKARVKIAK
jgi:hypothetical protein